MDILSRSFTETSTAQTVHPTEGASSKLELAVRARRATLTALCRASERSDADSAKAINAYRDAVYLEALIDRASTWTPEQWAQALTSETISIDGKHLDVSAITIDSAIRPRDVEENVEDASRAADTFGKTVERHMLWTDHVEMFDNPSDSEVVSALEVTRRDTLREMRAAFGRAYEQTAIEKAEVAEARATLERHMPRLAILGSVLELAKQGDVAAARYMDAIAHVPAPGWDTIAYFVEGGRAAR